MISRRILKFAFWISKIAQNRTSLESLEGFESCSIFVFINVSLQSLHLFACLCLLLFSMGLTCPYWGLKVDFCICALTYIVKYVLLGQKAGWTPCRLSQICHVHSIYQSVKERVVRQ